MARTSFTEDNPDKHKDAMGSATGSRSGLIRTDHGSEPFRVQCSRQSYRRRQCLQLRPGDQPGYPPNNSRVASLVGDS